MKLFIDIETVPQFETLKEASGVQQAAIINKYTVNKSNSVDAAWEKAALHAEFGKIVCVSMGYVNDGKITVKSVANHDERVLLNEVAETLKKASGLVAHNGKDFDFPFLCRRMILHGVPLPPILQIQNLKPWEIKLEDTMEMWRFGQFNYRVSLNLLCDLLMLPLPKSIMDGSQVKDVYYKENDLQKIAEYCEADVAALINVYRMLQYQPPILLEDANTK